MQAQATAGEIPSTISSEDKHIPASEMWIASASQTERVDQVTLQALTYSYSCSALIAGFWWLLRPTYEVRAKSTLGNTGPSLLALNGLAE